MANKKISQLIAKGSALAATDLVEISEDNGAGGYLTKSVTGANIKSGLQATLVSGTNIKTINSTSLLGSANINLQTPLVSGTDIKTINGTTLLGSGDLSLPTGVHVLTKPVSARTYNARRTCNNTGVTFNPAANTITLNPFIPANTLTVSNFQINVTALTIGGLIRILVYSDLNGVPNTKLLESTNQDCSTIGVKTYNASPFFTFTAGTTYWLGYHANLVLNTTSKIDNLELIPISTSANNFAAANFTVTAAATFGSAPTTLGTATPGTNAALFINLISA
jgi:hypothetical protein